MNIEEKELSALKRVAEYRRRQKVIARMLIILLPIVYLVFTIVLGYEIKPFAIFFGALFLIFYTINTFYGYSGQLLDLLSDLLERRLGADPDQYKREIQK